MWIFSETGFISVVEDKYKPSYLLVRARVQSDLEHLRKYGLKDILVFNNKAGNFDYQFRACVRKVDFARAMSKMVLDISYSNFKDRVLEASGEDRESVYLKIWFILRRNLGRGWARLSEVLDYSLGDYDFNTENEDVAKDGSMFLDPVYDHFVDRRGKL